MGEGIWPPAPLPFRVEPGVGQIHVTVVLSLKRPNARPQLRHFEVIQSGSYATAIPYLHERLGGEKRGRAETGLSPAGDGFVSLPLSRESGGRDRDEGRRPLSRLRGRPLSRESNDILRKRHLTATRTRAPGS